MTEQNEEQIQPAQDQIIYPESHPQTNNSQSLNISPKWAIASLSLGCFALVYIILFFAGLAKTFQENVFNYSLILALGFPIQELASVLGLVFGKKGLKSVHRNIARAGIVISLLTILSPLAMPLVFGTLFIHSSEKLNIESQNAYEKLKQSEKRTNDISFAKTNIKVYSPSYLPPGFIKQQPYYTDIPNGAVFQHVNQGENQGDNFVLSIINSNDAAIFESSCNQTSYYTMCSTYGKTTAGQNISFQRVSDVSQIYFVKIDSTYLTIEFAFGNEKAFKALAPEIMKIINSLQLIN